MPVPSVSVNTLFVNAKLKLLRQNDARAIALPFGTLRPRPKGSAGGHNGLKNISELLGTEEYARMRFGVGGDFPKGHQVDYVLGEWTDEEQKALPERLKVFVDAIRSFATVGTQLTMTNFNKK